MIKNKCKKIVSAMLLMTMIATMYSTNVFAGGDFSCVKVDNVNCEGVFKDCCGKKDDKGQNGLVEKATTDRESNETIKHSEKDELLEHEIDKIIKPGSDNKVDTSVQTSEAEVVIDSITLPTNIILTKDVKVDNSAQTCEDDITFSPIPDDKGNCGDNVNYLFYKSTGELVIQGKGEMKDYLCQDFLPWNKMFNKYKDKIKSVNIGNGVTSIGDFAFYGCTGLTSVIIPNSVKEIGALAFYGCKRLTSITIPDSVTSIREEAFYGCAGLKSVIIPKSTKIVENHFWSNSFDKNTAVHRK